MGENESPRKNKTRLKSTEQAETHSKSKRAKLSENEDDEMTARKTMMAWDLASPHSDTSDDDDGQSTEAQPGSSKTQPTHTIPDHTGSEIDCSIELALIEDILGDGKDKTFSSSVDDSIAIPWQIVTTTGFTPTQHKDFKNNNPIAENLSMLEAPDVNPELTKLLSDKVMKRDRIMQGHQDLLGRATASLGVAINELIKTNGNTGVINSLIETGQQLCSLFHKNTETRRNFVYHALDKETKHLLNQHKAGGKLLFGENLTDNLEFCKALINSLSTGKGAKKPTQAKPKVVPTPVHKTVYIAPPQVFIPPPLAPPGIRPVHPAPDRPPLPRAPEPAHQRFRPRGSGPRHHAPRPRGSGPRHHAPGPRGPRGYHHQSYTPRRGNPRGHFY